MANLSSPLPLSALSPPPCPSKNKRKRCHLEARTGSRILQLLGVPDLVGGRFASRCHPVHSGSCARVGRGRWLDCGYTVCGVVVAYQGHPQNKNQHCVKHREFAGLHFTGSTHVFKLLWKQIASNLDNYRSYPRIGTFIRSLVVVMVMVMVMVMVERRMGFDMFCLVSFSRPSLLPPAPPPRSRRDWRQEHALCAQECRRQQCRVEHGALGFRIPGYFQIFGAGEWCMERCIALRCIALTVLTAHRCCFKGKSARRALELTFPTTCGRRSRKVSSCTPSPSKWDQSRVRTPMAVVCSGLSFLSPSLSYTTLPPPHPNDPNIRLFELCHQRHQSSFV